MIFEKMLTDANHLGLRAGQTGASGEALGNFPQAFAYLALSARPSTWTGHRDR
jgi:GH15 family glucan-1,4-alpha-glucosidase